MKVFEGLVGTVKDKILDQRISDPPLCFKNLESLRELGQV